MEHVESLQEVLASRDAFRVFCVLLQCHQAHAATTRFHTAAKRELEVLLSNAEQEAESVATMLCACVAVTLSPADWPTWVASRFSPTGAAVLPIAPPLTAKKGSALTQVLQAVPTATPAKTWTASSPLHALAAHTLRHLAGQLPRTSTACGNSSLPLLRWLSQLCGVCLAPSPQAALRLAHEVGKVSLDAAGVALKAHCNASVVASVLCTDQNTHTTSAAVPQEERWLSLWTQLTQPSAVAPPSLPPFSLTNAISAGKAVSWSAGIAPTTLLEARVSWHLHCLLVAKAASHAARLLAGTFEDATLLGRDSQSVKLRQHDDGDDGLALADGTEEESHQVTLPIAHATQAELLSALPQTLLDANRLGERLSFSLLAAMRRTNNAQRGVTAPPPQRFFVPAVSTHAVVYARMLRYVLSSATQVQRGSSYVQHLHDLAALLSSADVHALAASFVPAEQPLTVVMVAAPDAHRSEYVQQVVSAVRAVVEVLCEEPTPASSSSFPLVGSLAEEPTGAPTQAGASPSKTLVTARKRAAKQAARDPLLRVQYSTASLGAFSWKWREEALGDVDGAVQAAAHFLISLLELCASRKNSLPFRKAEPKWRRELRERTAVRAHKFELLLQELPHDEIRAVLHTLLGHGYHREGSQLGVALLKGDQVDLRYYTLPLLGSLYLAVSTAAPSLPPPTCEAKDAQQQQQQQQPDDKAASDRWKQAVYNVYRRRFEIYGDADLNVTAPSYATPAGKAGGKASTALVCNPENRLVETLVLATMASTPASLKNGTAELANCLLNRRVVVAGRGVVVDVGASYSALSHGSVFGSWIRKGTTTL